MDRITTGYWVGPTWFDGEEDGDQTTTHRQLGSRQTYVDEKGQPARDKGASIYDVRKILGFPPLSAPQISCFCSSRLLFGDPPPPTTADVIYGSPLMVNINWGNAIL